MRTVINMFILFVLQGLVKQEYHYVFSVDDDDDGNS